MKWYMFLEDKVPDKLGMHADAHARIFRFAKSLRLKMTEAEMVLWDRLRKKQLNGYRFRRQHPISSYIVDFYCHALKLVIEVDGGYHKEPEQQALDQARTANLENFGLHVVRFSNQEVFEDIERVVAKIVLVVGEVEKGTRSPSVP